MEIKDIRVQKTRKSIEDAFLNLLKENSFENITIKDICEHAMISRSTFYSHYKDKYDLLEYFFERIISNFIAIGINYFSDKSMPLKIETAHELLTYVYNNADIFKTFLQLNKQNLDLFNYLTNVITQKCYEYFEHTNKVDKYNLGNEYIAQTYTLIIMNSIRWISVHQNPDDIDGILKLSSDINKYFLI